MKSLKWNKIHYSPIIVGFGSHQVNLVQLKKTEEGLSVSAALSMTIPTTVDREKNLRNLVRDCLIQGDFKGRDAAICLKGEDVFVQHQRLPQENRRKMEERLREEYRSNISFDIDQAEIRFITTGKVSDRGGSQDEVILMVVDRAVVDQYISILEGLHLVPTRVGVEPLALLRAVRGYPPPDLPEEGVTAIMNIGGSKTELLVIRDGKLAFIRSLPVAGDRFTGAIAGKLGIHPDNARRLKKAISFNESLNETLRDVAQSAFRPVMEEICTEIRSCFRYFSSIFNREAVDRLILAGEEVGGVINPSFIEGQVGVPVIPWNFSKLSGLDEILLKQKDTDSSFAPVIGQALEIMESSDSGVDFMSEGVVQHRQKKKSMTLRVAALALLVLGLCLLYLGVSKRQEKLGLMRDLVKSRSSLIHMKNDSLLHLNEEEMDLTEERTMLLGARPSLKVSRLIAEIARSSGEGITFRHFTLGGMAATRSRSNRWRDDAREESSPHSIMIRIMGLARSANDLSAFQDALIRSSAFTSICHEGFEDVAKGNQIVKSFTITLTVGGEVRDEVF